MTITIHEFSHGYVAYRLGDDTAKRAGRLNLNPWSHLDIIGAIMLFVAHIGWAKPVPINPYNFKDFKQGTALTAAAGPVSNFLLAILLAVMNNTLFSIVGAAVFSSSVAWQLLFFTLQFAVMINLALGLFNLIPIPPLDGSKILGGFLSYNAFFRYVSREKEGMGIFMLLIAVSYLFKLDIFGYVIEPPLKFFLKLLLTNLFIMN